MSDLSDPSVRERLRADIETGLDAVGQMCAKGRPPRMTIPTEPSDEDEVLWRALDAARSALDLIENLIADPATLDRAAEIQQDSRATDRPRYVTGRIVGDCVRPFASRAGTTNQGDNRMTIQEVCEKVLTKITDALDDETFDPAKVTGLAATYEMLTRGGRDD